MGSVKQQASNRQKSWSHPNFFLKKLSFLSPEDLFFKKKGFYIFQYLLNVFIILFIYSFS